MSRSTTFDPATEINNGVGQKAPAQGGNDLYKLSLCILSGPTLDSSPPTILQQLRVSRST